MHVYLCYLFSTATICMYLLSNTGRFAPYTSIFSNTCVYFNILETNSETSPRLTHGILV